MKKLLCFLTVALLSMLIFVSCDDFIDEPKTHEVTLVVTDGLTVTSKNPVRVEHDGTATFNVDIPGDYKFVKTTAGDFDEVTGTLTVTMVKKDMRVTLSAEKMLDSVLYYDPNGGFVYDGRENFKSNEYYTTEKDNGKLKVTIDQKVLRKMNAASLFYDDGTFEREGHVLIEYNTKPDGTGEAYSLGSKFPMTSEDRTLYCIWAKCHDESDFKFEEIEMPNPTTAALAPHWVTYGIRITEYLGDEETVVIPERIIGKGVISIGEGALKNKNVKTLVIGRRIQEIQDGAVTGCSSLETIYYPDSVYYVGNGALDAASYENLHNFYVNATMAPRYSDGDAAFAIKLARLMSCTDKPRIIMIGGSSAYQGLSSEYLEALLDNKYYVINFGTTRTTQGFMYLEAMKDLANKDDIILYAPENSIYMMGENRLYWKTLRDLEGMYNIFRHIDIKGYDNIFGAFAEFNAGDPSQPDPNGSPRFFREPDMYEDVIKIKSINKYGEYQHKNRAALCMEGFYKDVYVITLNNRVKSRLEGDWKNLDPNEDYNNPSNVGWCNLTDESYKLNMNRAIDAAKSSGAEVYFSFCPVDESKLASGVLTSATWLSDYEKLIKDNYNFDGLLGDVENYIYEHKYFYDNAFHLNDYGRAYRTYDVYLDICDLFETSSPKSMTEVGESFEGCLFGK